MYAKLYETRQDLALTDDTRYPCPSLPVPGLAFGSYEEPVINNREYYHEPSLPMRGPLLPMRSPVVSPPMRISSIPSSSSMMMMESTPSPMPEKDNLLPVLDCRFNLREVCKQSILLEDHLSHEKKRCTDCCIKHFLALEGLCEEAVTLDKHGHHKNLRGLADKVRHLQKKWYEDPENNSHYCSQELRGLRKQFQGDVFPIIFQDTPACSGNTCSLRK